MSPKILLLLLLSTVLALANLATAQNLPLPPLPYPYDALEPHIDERTMRIHHLKHHDGYRKKINIALAILRSDPSTKHLAKMGVFELLSELDKIPAELTKTVRENGGGYVNHADFFESLAAHGVGAGGDESFVSTELQKAIVQSFGTYQDFKESFKQAALSQFGSGWAYFYYNQKEQKVTLAPNNIINVYLIAGSTSNITIDYIILSINR